MPLKTTENLFKEVTYDSRSNVRLGGGQVLRKA